MCESILSMQTQQNERYTDVGVKCGWIIHIWGIQDPALSGNAPQQRGPQRRLQFIYICPLCFCLGGRMDHLKWVKWHSVAPRANTDRKLWRYLTSSNIHSTNSPVWSLQRTTVSASIEYTPLLNAHEIITSLWYMIKKKALWKAINTLCKF